MNIDLTKVECSPNTKASVPVCWEALYRVSPDNTCIFFHAAWVPIGYIKNEKGRSLICVHN